MKKIFIFAILFLSFFKAFSQDSSKGFWGIDVSFYQRNINWSDLDTNISFVICKATEGNFVDPMFSYNWNQLDSKHCIKGCYHFFRPQISGVIQAKTFLSTIDLCAGNMRPIIDVEYIWGWPCRNRYYLKKCVDNLNQMVQYIKDNTGLVPIIYTNACFWNRFVLPYYKYSDNSLWIADWRKNVKPQLPNNFNDWSIWQVTNYGKVQGVRGFVDKNYCKDLDSLLITDILY